MDKFRKFLRDNGILEVYCDVMLCLGRDDVSGLRYRFLISGVFDWMTVNNELSKPVNLSYYTKEWEKICGYTTETIPHTSMNEFIKELLEGNKKRILLNSIKDFV